MKLVVSFIVSERTQRVCLAVIEPVKTASNQVAAEHLQKVEFAQYLKQPLVFLPRERAKVLAMPSALIFDFLARTVHYCNQCHSIPFDEGNIANEQNFIALMAS